MEDQQFTLTVNTQDIQVIGNALAQRPYAEVKPLIEKLQIQVDKQSNQSQGTGQSDPTEE